MCSFTTGSSWSLSSECRHLLSTFFTAYIFICRVRAKADHAALGPHATQRQHALVIERSNVLLTKINTWISIQQLYMPCAAALRMKDAENSSTGGPDIKPWDIKLYLPSEVGLQSFCDAKLQECEWKLREAQAYDTLDERRDSLRLSTHLYKHKKAFIRGQRPSTRARTVIARADAKAQAAADRYRTARQALVRLGTILKKPSSWKKTLKLLQHQDVRAMNAPLFGESEGRRSLSWIWLTAGVGTGAGHDTALHNCMMVVAIQHIFH
jgi:hypothetical protein